MRGTQRNPTQNCLGFVVDCAAPALLRDYNHYKKIPGGKSYGALSGNL